MVKGTTATGATGTVTALLAGLAWLGTAMYAAHATIDGGASGALGAAAAALPSPVAATLVAGASVGAAAGRRLPSPVGRLRAGVALGAVLGLAAAAGMRFAYGDGTLVMVLAVAASVVGGALAVLPGDVLKAGLWGTTWVFLAGVMFGVLQPQLVKVLGGGEVATTQLVLGQSLVTGLAAALCSLRLLRVEGKRVLWQLVGGALPGLVLLGAHWLTRAGGSAVDELVHGLRGAPPPLVELSDSARLRHALIVLAVGAPTALLVGVFKSLLSWPRRRRTPASVQAFHHELARIGLEAAERYGFALAGGHAMQAAGLLERSTEDIDLFTVWDRRGEFEAAARAVVDAYLRAGLRVETERRHDTFTRLTVSDGSQTATVDLGVDLRANDPVRTPIGPALHPDDVVANKIRALYERTHASDFIDIDAVLRSGRYDPSMLLLLAQRSDITLDATVLADAFARAQLLPADDFARYGLVGEELEGLRRRFSQWRTGLLDTVGPAG